MFLRITYAMGVIVGCGQWPPPEGQGSRAGGAQGRRGGGRRGHKGGRLLLLSFRGPTGKYYKVMNFDSRP